MKSLFQNEKQMKKPNKNDKKMTKKIKQKNETKMTNKMKKIEKKN